MSGPLKLILGDASRKPRNFQLRILKSGNGSLKCHERLNRAVAQAMRGEGAAVLKELGKYVGE